ncbi:MAG: cytochrome c biogenesis protein CcsA [Solirubrobacteraceae bacterium]
MTRRLLHLYPGDRATLLAALLTLAGGWAMGLAWAPPDAFQGEVQRLMYVHVPTAWAALGLFAVAFLASVRVLWKRSLAADQLAHAAVAVGLLFTALTLVLGSLWGRAVWGVWWTWDPRLTTTAILFTLFAGQLALRRAFDDAERRATVASAAAVLAFGLVPIVHWSVVWWRSLHQEPSVLRLDGPTLDGAMLATLLVNTAGISLLAAWLVMRRLRVCRLEMRAENRRLRARLAEAAPLAPISPRELRG